MKALDVKCPTCKALPGSPCTPPEGVGPRVKGTHFDRDDLAYLVG